MPKFTVERSILIDAPAGKAYSIVRDFKLWRPWSPWLTTEPECKVDVASDGLSYSWEGEIVGSGKMEIVDEKENSGINYRLTFLKPWKSVSSVSFAFDAKDEATRVTWTMHGSLPFFLFWMKPMMTAWIGMDYQRGLAMLKDYVETGSVPSKLEFTGDTSFDGFSYLGISSTCSIPEIGPQMERDFEKLTKWFEQGEAKPIGKPFCIYHKFDMVKEVTSYTIGFPVDKAPPSLPENIASGEMPSCETYAIKHTGPYLHLGGAWSAGMMRARSKVFKQDKRIHPFEVYENTPMDVAENELITVVHFPAK